VNDVCRGTGLFALKLTVRFFDFVVKNMVLHVTGTCKMRGAGRGEVPTSAAVTLQFADANTPQTSAAGCKAYRRVLPVISQK